MLNISVIVTNPEEDGMYIPFAKAQARAFVKQWNGYYLSRVLDIEETDTRILIEVVSPDFARVTITSVGPYMESGIFEVRRANQNVEETYLPALIKFTPRVASLSGPVPNTYGRKLSDGDESWTEAGCRESKKLETISVGDPGRTFTSPTPAYCSPEAILERKLLMEAVPPSVFTGKMRLYAQALYGSLRKDFSYRRIGAHGELIMAVPKDSENPETFIKSGYPTTGLLTVKPGKYLLVTVAPQGITYRMMSSINKRAAKKSKERETYELSKLKPLPGLRTASASMPELPGAPIAYGWKFNDSGMTAHMTVVKPIKKLATQISGLTVTPGVEVNAYRFTLMRLRFTWDDEEESLSAEVDEVESGEHVPATQTRIWFPTDSKVIFQMLTPPGLIAQNAFANEDAPIYCYYDAEDKLIVTRVKQTIPAETPPINEAAIAGANLATWWGALRVPQSSTKAVPGGPSVWSVFPQGRETEPFGPYSSQFSALDEQKVYFGPSTETTYAISPGGRTRYHPPNGSFSLFSAAGHEAAGSYVNAVLTTDLQFRYDVSLLIPNEDAAAVVSISQKYTAASLVNFSYSMILDEDRYYSGNPEELPGVPLGPITYLNGTASVSTAARDFSLVPYADQEQARQVGVQGYLITEVRVNNTHKSVLAYLQNIIVPRGDNGPFNSRPFAALSEATIQNNFYTNPIDVRTSYFGACRHLGLQPPGAPSQLGYDNGWPEDADIPVGWA